MLPEGSIAPDFQLPVLGGDVWALTAELAKGPVLVVFFKVSCPVCQFTLPILPRLADALQIVGISQDDGPATTKFLTRFDAPIRTLLDPGGDYPVSGAFRISHVPSVFLIEPDRTISLSADGFSKAHLERIGERFGVVPFGIHEQIPALRPG